MHTFRPFALLAAVLVLTSCATADRPEVYPKITFTHLPFIQLESASLQVVNQYRPPLRSPNVEHLSPVTFENAVRSWAQHRLRPTGVGRDQIVVTLTEGSITEKVLPTDTGITGAFKKEQAVEYEAVADVVVQLVESDGTVRAEATGRAWHSQTAGEKLSDHDRNMIWIGMIEKTLNELDTRIEAGIRQYFGPSLRS